MEEKSVCKDVKGKRSSGRNRDKEGKNIILFSLSSIEELEKVKPILNTSKKPQYYCSAT